MKSLKSIVEFNYGEHLPYPTFHGQNTHTHTHTQSLNKLNYFAFCCISQIVCTLLKSFSEDDLIFGLLISLTRGTVFTLPKRDSRVIGIFSF